MIHLIDNEFVSIKEHYDLMIDENKILYMIQNRLKNGWINQMVRIL